MSRRSSTRSLDDSSVIVQSSPVSSIKQKGNLTGNVRVVREHVFDIRAFVLQWNSELLDGTRIISEIKNIMCKKLNAKKSEFALYIKDLHKLSISLEKICEEMELLVEKIGQKSANMLALSRLEDRHKHTKPLFLTWPASKFAEISQQVYEMFRREIELKIAIKEEICFCTDKNTLIFLETAWFHQPYVEKAVNLNFEAMLKEVGHSSLSTK